MAMPRALRKPGSGNDRNWQKLSVRDQRPLSLTPGAGLSYRVRGQASGNYAEKAICNEKYSHAVNPVNPRVELRVHAQFIRA